MRVALFLFSGLNLSKKASSGFCPKGAFYFIKAVKPQKRKEHYYAAMSRQLPQKFL